MAQQLARQYEDLLTPQFSPSLRASDEFTSTTPPGSPATAESPPTAADTPLLRLTAVETPAKDESAPPKPAFDCVPRLIPNDTSTVRGRVVIFNTFTNKFSLRLVGPDMSLRSIALKSPNDRILQMPILSFESKVDLRKAGVQVGEGLVDDIMQPLPKTVVAMRVLGWYQTLYVIRGAEVVEKWRAELEV